MRISELIEDLRDALDANGDREVMIAQQPSWPLAARLVQVYDPADDVAEDDKIDDDAVLWLATAESGDYAPRRAWSEVYS